MTHEGNLVATLRYPGSQNYYLTRDDSPPGTEKCFGWRRDWSDRFGGLFRAFIFNNADALLEKARAVPFEPGGTMMVKTIYEARVDEKNSYVEVHEAVGFDLINRRLSRAEQNTILKECEPQGTFFLGVDKEAEWISALVAHPRFKEIKASRYDVGVWFTHRRRAP